MKKLDLSMSGRMGDLVAFVDHMPYVIGLCILLKGSHQTV